MKIKCSDGVVRDLNKIRNDMLLDEFAWSFQAEERGGLSVEESHRLDFKKEILRKMKVE